VRLAGTLPLSHGRMVGTCLHLEARLAAAARACQPVRGAGVWRDTLACLACIHTQPICLPRLVAGVRFVADNMSPLLVPLCVLQVCAPYRWRSTSRALTSSTWRPACRCGAWCAAGGCLLACLNADLLLIRRFQAKPRPVTCSVVYGFD
jgi:hypothetical protein